MATLATVAFFLSLTLALVDNFRRPATYTQRWKD